MATYIARSPNGLEYELEGPDGATDEQVVYALTRHLAQQKLSEKQARAAEEEKARAALAPKPDQNKTGLADLWTSLKQGAVGSTKALTDFAGAGNAASTALAKTGKSIEQEFSPQRQAELKAASERMRKAEESGSTLEEIKAGVQNIAEAPLQAAAQGIGSFAPYVPAMIAGYFAGPVAAALGLSAKGASAVASVARGLGATIGTAQGAGAVKGAIYDRVKQEAKEAGATDEQAEAKAQNAQAYLGDNWANILAATGLGYVASRTGVEKALPGVGTPAAKESLLRTMGAEMGTEAAQGGQERFAANVAATNAGYESPAMQGVFGQATTEGLTSVLSAGAIHAATPGASQATPTRPGQPTPAAPTAGPAKMPPIPGVTPRQPQATAPATPAGVPAPNRRPAPGQAATPAAAQATPAAAQATPAAAQATPAAAQAAPAAAQAAPAAQVDPYAQAVAAVRQSGVPTIPEIRKATGAGKKLAHTIMRRMEDEGIVTKADPASGRRSVINFTPTYHPLTAEVTADPDAISRNEFALRPAGQRFLQTLSELDPAEAPAKRDALVGRNLYKSELFDMVFPPQRVLQAASAEADVQPVDITGRTKEDVLAELNAADAAFYQATQARDAAPKGSPERDAAHAELVRIGGAVAPLRAAAVAQGWVRPPMEELQAVIAGQPAAPAQDTSKSVTAPTANRVSEFDSGRLVSEFDSGRQRYEAAKAALRNTQPEAIATVASDLHSMADTLAGNAYLISHDYGVQAMGLLQSNGKLPRTGTPRRQEYDRLQALADEYTDLRYAYEADRREYRKLSAPTPSAPDDVQAAPDAVQAAPKPVQAAPTLRISQYRDGTYGVDWLDRGGRPAFERTYRTEADARAAAVKAFGASERIQDKVYSWELGAELEPVQAAPDAVQAAPDETGIAAPALAEVPSVPVRYRADVVADPTIADPKRYPGKFWTSRRSYMAQGKDRRVTRVLRESEDQPKRTLNITTLSEQSDADKQAMLADFESWMAENHPTVSLEDAYLYDVLADNQSDFAYPTKMDTDYLRSKGYDSVYFDREGGEDVQTWFMFDNPAEGSKRFKSFPGIAQSQQQVRELVKEYNSEAASKDDAYRLKLVEALNNTANFTETADTPAYMRSVRSVANAALEDHVDPRDLQALPVTKEPEVTYPETEPGGFDADTVAFLRGKQASGVAMTPEAVRDVILDMRKTWATGGPNLSVIPTFNQSTVPEDVWEAQQDAIKNSIDEAAEASARLGRYVAPKPVLPPAAFLYSKDRVVVIADRMSSPEDVAFAVTHEVLGHYGLRAVISPQDRVDLYTRIHKERPEEIAKIREDYGYKATDPDTWAIQAEEVVIHLADRSPGNTLVQNTIAAIRSWLRRNIPMLSDMELSDAEIIRSFIQPARDYILRYGNKKGKGNALIVPTPPAFLRKVPQTQTELQKIALSSDLANEPPKTAFSWLKDMVDAGTDGISRLTKTRTLYADNAASVVEKLLLNGDRQAHQLVAQYRQAQDISKMLVPFAEYGGLELDPATGQFVVTDATESMKTVTDKVKAWADAKGFDFDTAQIVISKMFEGGRVLALHNYNVSNKLKSGDKGHIPIHKLSQNDARSALVQAQEAVAEMNADPEAQAIKAELDAIRIRLVDWMQKVGRISEKDANAWRDALEYVPFDRIQEMDKTLVEGGGFRPQRTKGKGPSQLGNLGELIGTTQREVGNVFSNSVKLHGWMLAQIANQHTTLQTLRALERNGYATWLGDPNMQVNGTTAKNRYNLALRSGTVSRTQLVKTYVNGQDTYFALPSRYDVLAYTQMPIQLQGIFKMMSKFSNFLRVTITSMPPFAAMQVAKDIQRAFAQSGVNNPYPMVFDTLKNFVSISYAEVRGKQHPVVDFFERRAVTGEYDLDTSNPVETVLHMIGAKKRGLRKEIFHRLEGITRASDLAVRAAIHKQTLKETGDTFLAEKRAREFINFRRRGASNSMAVASATIPFFNAYVQGMDVLLRSITGKDGPTGLPAAKARGLLVKRLGTLMAISTLYALSRAGDDDYDRADPRLKNANFLLGNGIRIPVADDIGVFYKTIPETLLDYYRRKGTSEERDAVEATVSVLRAMGEVYVGRTVPIPTAVRPIIEAVTNHSMFTGRELEGIYQKKKDPWDRTTGSTSELAAMVGKQFNVSPIMVDNFLQSYFGSVAGMFTMATDQLINPDRLDRPINKWWFLSSFMYDPTAGGVYKAEAYDASEQYMSRLNTMRSMMSSGADEAEIEDYLNKYEEEIDLGRVLEAQFARNSQIRKEIKWLSSSSAAEEYSKEERDQLIRELRKEEDESLMWLREAQVEMRKTKAARGQ